jgi:hypothetical protein
VRTVIAYEGQCPKCGTWFDTGGPTPFGVLCPECKRLGWSIVGVVYGDPVYGDDGECHFTTA